MKNPAIHFIKRNLYLIFLVVILFSSCKSRQWVITDFSSTKIPIDSSTNAMADKSYEAYLLPLKQEIDAEMNVVIGRAEEPLRAYRPESPLSNFSADVYRQTASEWLGEEVNIGIVNIGGLRTEISEGDVTVGNIFKIMPFENELVILWLTGDKLAALCDVIAQVKGEGVSGIQMGIKDEKAVNVKINGQPIDRSKTYTIATNDYLAGGNDKLVQLAQYAKREDTGLKVRDVLINYVKKENVAGRALKAQIEGRITPNP